MKDMAITMKERLQQLAGICRRNRLVLAIALLSVFLIYSPHLQKGILTGSDAPFHLSRMESLAAELENGTFPVKVHSMLSYGYGYGVGFFYQNHLLYIPAFLQFLGLSLEVSFKIFAAMMIAATYGLTFYGALRITEDRYCATLAAVAFLFSGQLLSSYYQAFTLGSSLGMIFIPLAIAGMIEFLMKDKPPVMLAIGFLGLACTHLISAYMTFFVCAVLLLAYGKKMVQTPKKLLQLLLAVSIVLGLSLSFWLPMWEQFRQQIYKVSTPWTTPEEHIVTFWGLFGYDSFGWLFMIYLFVSGVLIFSRRKTITNAKLLITLFFIAIGIIATQLIKSFWIIAKPVAGMLQFPRRLVAVGVVVVIFMAVLLISQWKIEGQQKKIFLIINVSIVMLYAGLSSIGNLRTEREDFTDRVLYNEIAGIGAGEEWLPIETTREMMNAPNTATANDGTIVNGKKVSGKFTFKADLSKEYYDIPFIWYRGYKAVSNKGDVFEIDKNPETSMVRVYVEESNYSGEEEVTVWYNGTKIQKLAYVSNIMAIFGLISVILLRPWMSKKWREKSEKSHRLVG
ncbi:hypothetical protein [Kineothrix sp. MB12-C1]|uniref:hypothetical protein n=1 Tax=Kineothrix sp. MB12-C1 TaxID=3070215 RepID=UPI0027D20740|nr:hypothetical protein [Kineothrix sp. MB12-C1]WMC91670.1 hypothetical protein RBB56_12445 [Kineothrix sp. MB12-C1]